jgi:predicted nucleotidyltransferase
VEILKENNVKKVGIFGSYARGEQKNSKEKSTCLHTIQSTIS